MTPEWLRPTSGRNAPFHFSDTSSLLLTQPFSNLSQSGLWNVNSLKITSHPVTQVIDTRSQGKEKIKFKWIFFLWDSQNLCTRLKSKSQGFSNVSDLTGSSQFLYGFLGLVLQEHPGGEGIHLCLRRVKPSRLKAPFKTIMRNSSWLKHRNHAKYGLKKKGQSDVLLSKNLKPSNILHADHIWYQFEFFGSSSVVSEQRDLPPSTTPTPLKLTSLQHPLGLSGYHGNFIQQKKRK